MYITVNQKSYQKSASPEPIINPLNIVFRTCHFFRWALFFENLSTSSLFFDGFCFQRSKHDLKCSSANNIHINRNLTWYSDNQKTLKQKDAFIDYSSDFKWSNKHTNTAIVQCKQAQLVSDLINVQSNYGGRRLYQYKEDDFDLYEAVKYHRHT